MAVNWSRLQATVWMTLLSLALVCAANSVSAQDSVTSASKELYDQANKAETVDELSRVLKKIETLRGGQISVELQTYLSDLQAWVHHRRGETYMKQAAQVTSTGDQQTGKKLDALAFSDFHSALQLAPTRWKSFHHRGVCYALAGRFEEALSDFTKTIEIRPSYAIAWFNRGEIRYELGQFANAVEDYNEAIRLQPKDAGFYTSRGHANFQLRRFQMALDDYSQAVDMNPNDAECYANRGDAFRSLGQWELAADDFRKAIKLDVRMGRGVPVRAWLMATCPDDRYRNPDLAVHAARKAIELEGTEDYIYLDTLAAAYANSGNFDHAQSTMRRAIRLAPAENISPLKRRLSLYMAQKPFRQVFAKSANQTDKKTLR